MNVNAISRKILCVDDEPNVLEGLRRQLRRDHQVDCAASGQEGLATIERDGPFAVVISDYNMPGMNGVEFLHNVLIKSPDTTTIMLSGRAELDIAVAALHEGRIFRFLNKPCPREALLAAIRDGLEQHRLVVSEKMLTAALNQANVDLRQLNENLEQRVRERTAVISRLHRFVSELSGCDQLEQVARIVIQTTAEMLRSRRVSLMMPEVGGEYLSIVAAIGMDAEIRDRVRVPVGAPIAGAAFAECRSIVINELDPMMAGRGRHDSDVFAVEPLISTALVTSGRALAVLNVTEPDEGSIYDEDAVSTLQTIAESAAVALQNQLRLRERNEARDGAILALAKLAEHRDPETGAHLERVQTYCRMLSETLAKTAKHSKQIDPDFISGIYQSAPLHDIGKVGIPDHILLKPGKLTPEEFEIMKTHTNIGGDTIRAVVQRHRSSDFLQLGMEIAYNHHEKFDGSGYPSGLAGEDIPLSARILALADVYDALTSRRVYKRAMDHEEAAKIIYSSCGSHFDPDVVDAFRQLESDFETVAQELREQSEISSLATSTP